MVCSTYHKKGKGKCTSHQIRNSVIEDRILTDLRNATSYASDQEEDFIKLATQTSEKALNKSTKEYRREYEQSSARIAKLDVLIQRIYEDNVVGKISDERFVKMPESYETEQRQLKSRVAELQNYIGAAKEKSVNVDRFLALVQKYTDIISLDVEILLEFVEKVIVYQPEKVDGHRQQEIEII